MHLLSFLQISMAADLRMRTLSVTRGLMKALIGEDGSILGLPCSVSTEERVCQPST
jgi:hypothetical protein